MNSALARTLRAACYVAIVVVSLHLLLVLNGGGYSFTLAGLTLGSHRIRSPMMLLAGLIAGLAFVLSGQPVRNLPVSRRAVGGDERPGSTPAGQLPPQHAACLLASAAD